MCTRLAVESNTQQKHIVRVQCLLMYLNAFSLITTNKTVEKKITREKDMFYHHHTKEKYTLLPLLNNIFHASL